MKNYPHGLTLNAVCAAIDDYQRHEDSVPEEGILAAFNTLLGHSDIADALRSMERTADANMAAAQAMRDDMYHWKQRAEAAEAKQDYFGSLVSKARISADKAMVKFPQPNYVLLKVAEEAGEVVQAGVHYAENRMSWGEVEGEIVQLVAMLIRLVTEGDQVNGIKPPESCRDFSPAPAAELVPEGWKMVPVEPTEEMIAAGDQFMDGLSRLGDAYDAMLAAAPGGEH